MLEINKVPYNILATGSKGNAIIYFNELLVDIGVSYKTIEPYENEIKYVFITHEHSDHFNKKTIKTLASKKPLIKFIVGEHLYHDITAIIEPYKVIKVDLNSRYALGKNIFISPIFLYHNVINYGLRIFSKDIKIIHATDTYTLEGIEAKNYDYYMYEVNFCEERIKLLDELRSENEFSHSYSSRENHLSKQKAYAHFNAQNEWGKGVLVPLHQSDKYL